MVSITLPPVIGVLIGECAVTSRKSLSFSGETISQVFSHSPAEGHLLSVQWQSLCMMWIIWRSLCSLKEESYSWLWASLPSKVSWIGQREGLPRYKNSSWHERCDYVIFWRTHLCVWRSASSIKQPLGGRHLKPVPRLRWHRILLLWKVRTVTRVLPFVLCLSGCELINILLMLHYSSVMEQESLLLCIRLAETVARVKSHHVESQIQLFGLVDVHRDITVAL